MLCMVIKVGRITEKDIQADRAIMTMATDLKAKATAAMRPLTLTAGLAATAMTVKEVINFHLTYKNKK